MPIRERPPVPTVVKSLPSQEDPQDQASDLNEIENTELHEAISKLSPVQLKAANLEASGTPKNLIATQLGMSRMQLHNWRKDENYIKVIRINLILLDRQGREFRARQVKQILAPAYVELYKRMKDPVVVANMVTKDLIYLTKTMSNEVRQDVVIAGDNDAENDLTDLQKRRTLVMKQQKDEIDRLEEDENIIRFPIKKSA